MTLGPLVFIAAFAALALFFAPKTSFGLIY
jgi:hypothetical protein